MTTETMTVHQALSTLKTLDKRINKDEQKLRFVDCVVNKADKIEGIPISEFEENIKNDYSSYGDKLTRYIAIKNAVIQSNATTHVSVLGENMTVAEAIAYKNYIIPKQKALVAEMSFQLNRTENTITDTNLEVEERANEEMVRIYGSKEKVADQTEMYKFRDNYVERNNMVMIDPMNVRDLMTEVNERLDKFETELDSQLSVSNAQTVITVEY